MTRSYVNELRGIIDRGDLKAKAGDIRKMEWISIPLKLFPKKMRRELRLMASVIVPLSNRR